MNKPPRKAPPPRFTIVQQRPDRRPLIVAVLAIAWLGSLAGAWWGAERHTAPVQSQVAGSRYSEWGRPLCSTTRPRAGSAEMPAP